MSLRLFRGYRSRSNFRYFFRKRRCPEGLIWAQLVVNARGRCCVVVVEQLKGRSSTLFISVGTEVKAGVRWEML